MTAHRFPLLRLAGLAAFLVAAVLVGVLVPLPPVDELRRAVADAGLPGAALFAVGYALVTLTPAPKSVLSITAGVVGGFVVGVLTVYAGALLGAAAAFVIARRLGRDAVGRLVGGRFDAVDRAVAARGLLGVLTLRLIPLVPFTAINYAAGLTTIRFRDYAVATAIGIVPGDIAYVAVGALGARPGWGLWAAIGALALLSAAGTVLGVRVGRRRPGAPRA